MLSTVLEHQDVINHCQHIWPVGNQHHGAASSLERIDGLHQRHLSGFIEIGVGFIEHDQRRVPIELSLIHI